jgi:hypothetical protein
MLNSGNRLIQIVFIELAPAPIPGKVPKLVLCVSEPVPIAVT